jgi:hypothetical protein
MRGSTRGFVAVGLLPTLPATRGGVTSFLFKCSLFNHTLLYEGEPR